jgi:hypothetical protein
LLRMESDDVVVNVGVVGKLLAGVEISRREA